MPTSKAASQGDSGRWSVPTKPVLHQDWHHLLFLHWETAPHPLRTLLPSGLTLDLFQGKAYVGLIPFTVRNSRLAMVSRAPQLGDFHEVNVRTYVRLGSREGVYFFSLDAASRSAVLAARMTYKLPYHFARMSMSVEDNEIGLRSERRWPGPLPASCSIRHKLSEAIPRPEPPGTIGHFLVERYTLFTYSRGKLHEATVEHEPYRIQTTDLLQADETLIWASGIRKSEHPPLAHYSPVVQVAINPLHPASP